MIQKNKYVKSYPLLKVIKGSVLFSPAKMWRQDFEITFSLFCLTLKSLKLLIESRSHHHICALSGASLQFISFASGHKNFIVKSIKQSTLTCQRGK